MPLAIAQITKVLVTPSRFDLHPGSERCQWSLQNSWNWGRIVVSLSQTAYRFSMARETQKLLKTRADAANAAVSAAMSARDAQIAREIVQQAIQEIQELSTAVEMLNGGLASLSESLAETKLVDLTDVNAQLAALKEEVERLKSAKKNGRHKNNPGE
jgi:chromosome segregation ATPase